MNKVILFMLMLSIAQPNLMQAAGVRNSIKSFCLNKYPNAKLGSIENETVQYYSQFFKIGSDKYVAKFTLNGEWVQTEKKVKIKDVPNEVRQTLSAGKYGLSKVLDVRILELPNQSAVTYYIDVLYFSTAWDGMGLQGVHRLYFTSAGVMTKDELQETETFSNEP